MDKQIITFSANEQNLVRIGGEYHYSSNKVSYIGAHFDLGANWDGFDSVRAVWFTDRINGISTVLDGEGNCTVPTEVLKKKDRVFVNLVGSIVSNGELTDRLTTYPAVALVVDSKAKVDSTETAPVTPSQFEQFVSIVQDAVANIKDIVSTTLNADYTLTFVYSDGTSYTTPSIRGERGPQGADGADGTDGNGIASAVLNSNYTLTLTFTDGTSYTTPSIRGAQGPKGDPGDVSQAQLDAAVSDLKSEISPYVDVWYPAKYNIPKSEFPNNGYIATASGAVVGASDTNWLNTDFIKVDEGAVIEGKLYLGLTGVVNSVSCYGSDFSYRASDSLSSQLNGTFTVPSGVTYARFCCASSYTGQYVKISSGAYKQGYIPYADNKIYGAKKNTNLIMIGDSYGIQNSDSDITKFFWEYVKDGLKLTEGVDFFKKFVIGTGFGSGGFLSNLQSLESSISNKEAITDIFVCGGWNDSDTSQSYGTDEAFTAGILAFDNYVKDTYPNARISLAHIGWGRLGEGMRTQLHRSFRRYVKASNTYGWRYITNSEYILHDYTTSNWQTDGAHPNNNGQKLLGESIVSAFLTGTADVYYASESSALTQYGYAPAISGNIYSEVNNNMCRVWSNSTNGLIEITGFTNNGLTPSGATEYAIAKITTPYFRGYQHYSCVETGCVLLANSKYYHGTAKLRFDGDTVYARFYVPHDEVNTWLGNLTNIYIVDFDLFVATIRA